MKIDGNRFMRWLHKMREQETKKVMEDKRTNESTLVKEIIKKYRIPVVRV